MRTLAQLPQLDSKAQAMSQVLASDPTFARRPKDQEAIDTFHPRLQSFCESLISMSAQSA